jgi:hypothetical protein
MGASCGDQLCGIASAFDCRHLGKLTECQNQDDRSASSCYVADHPFVVRFVRIDGITFEVLKCLL